LRAWRPAPAPAPAGIARWPCGSVPAATCWTTGLEPGFPDDHDNRSGGPELVIDLVEDRAPSGFIDLDRVVSYAELEAIVKGYARTAGIDQAQVTASASARAEPAADGLWPASPYIHPSAEEVTMTTEEVSRITTTARRSGLMWRQAGGRNPTSAPAAELEHELVVLSRHRTYEGVVTYARCNCGELQIWLTGAGRPAHTLIKSIRGPERPVAGATARMTPVTDT
jgi:hypothetical protein